ncbi:MAG TPA: hypothetical protein VMG08_19375 [Allosphingosinicella sp.]|nr:hypothetical protein [Allosphingosinicella sp.]
MRRLLALLLICALSVSNAAGLAAATCRHDNADAHALALQSADAAIAAEAAKEDIAALATEKDGALADTAGASLSSFIVPAGDLAYSIQTRDSPGLFLATPASLSGRSLRPLLDPPLA